MKSPKITLLIGRFGYCIREVINEFRGFQNKISDFLNEKCFSIIDWLDSFASVKYWRKKDRGI